MVQQVADRGSLALRSRDMESGAAIVVHAAGRDARGNEALDGYNVAAGARKAQLADVVQSPAHTDQRRAAPHSDAACHAAVGRARTVG